MTFPLPRHPLPKGLTVIESLVTLLVCVFLAWIIVPVALVQMGVIESDSLALDTPGWAGAPADRPSNAGAEPGGPLDPKSVPDSSTQPRSTLNTPAR